MKLITFAVPCYNSEAYMDKCIESILTAGNDIEVLIVDDGSTDSTGAKADAYEAQYPGIVKVIHKPNGGHGDAVNTAIEAASGRYFKVVDSDDWLDKETLAEVIQLINDMELGGTQIDLLAANYVYEHVADGKRHEIKYTHVFPQNQVFGWDDIGYYLPSQYLLMHAIIYRTEVLRRSGVRLPKHTFYVDNIFAFNPLSSVERMYYFNRPFYHYYIGRSDQSVNEAVMISRVDQQIRVTKIMTDHIHTIDKEQMSPKLFKYLLHYLGMMYTVCSALLITEGSDESLKKRDELWKYCQDTDPELFSKLKSQLLVTFTNFKGTLGIKVGSLSYRLMQKIYKFN